MTNLLKSLPARCWVISLGLFLATLAAAHFFPSEILTASAKLAALPFLFCTVVFFSYLGFKATCNPIGLIAITTMFLAIAYWQASWAILCVGLAYLGLVLDRYLSVVFEINGLVRLSRSEERRV
uniref:hypothetical protein n=2 Tax=Neptunomonas phycophila TaxID=1572645 RepID=UPI00355AA68E